MDDTTVSEHAAAHAQAMAGGDLNRAAEDLSDDARAGIGPVMKAMPRPITGADVESISADGDEYIVNIRYSGEETETTLESRWAEVDGRPMIVEVKVV